MENEKISMLTQMFNSRFETISNIVKEQEKEQTDEVPINDIDLVFSNCTEEEKNKINDFVQTKVENNNLRNSMLNEKYYKFGVSDITKLLFEALMFKG